MATDDACITHWNKHVGAGQDVNLHTLQALLTSSPTAEQELLTERLIVEFLEGWLTSSAAASPAPAATRAPPVPSGSGAKGSTASRIASSPKTLLQRARSTSRGSTSSSSPSPTRSDSRSGSPILGRKFSQAQYLAACRELPGFAQQTFGGTLVVGNGRSVLGCGAGPAVDRYKTVVRFNEFQIDGFEADVGRKTDVWVVSDWTAIKLFAKYPERRLPTIIAVPYKFMGKPYYHERRAEVDRDLTEEQRERVTFVPAQDVQRLIEENHFGDRWPSSGLITIVYFLNLGKPKIHLHGFDFFKEIGEPNPESPLALTAIPYLPLVATWRRGCTPHRTSR